MTGAVVYKLYSHRPLSTAANQQLAVSTGTIATYFGNLAPPCGCLHAEVHELCVRALSADISARRRSLHITRADIVGPKGLKGIASYLALLIQEAQKVLIIFDIISFTYLLIFIYIHAGRDLMALESWFCQAR